MANVEEARTKFFEAKKAVTDCMATKIRLEARKAEMSQDLEKFEERCVASRAEKWKLTQSFALGALSQKQYDVATKGFVVLEQDRAQCEELVAVVTQCLVDCDNEITPLQQELNEAECKFFAAIAETLEAEIKSKIPFQSLRMLAYARLHAGKVQGREAWRNMLVDIIGAGRFTSEDMETISAEVKKTFGL